MSTINLQDLLMSQELNNSSSAKVYDINFIRKSYAFSKYGLGSLIRMLPNISSLNNEINAVDKEIREAPTIPILISLNQFVIVPGQSNAITYFAHVYYERATKLFVLIPGVGVLPGKKSVSVITIQEATSIYLKDKKHHGKFKTAQAAERGQKLIAKAAVEWLKALSGPSDSQNFGEFITEINVSLTIDGASQVQFTVVDKDYVFMENNYFQNRRKFLYRGDEYEIGAVEVGQGEGSSPYVTVTGWESSVQEMKRDKKPENIAGSSVYEYAQNAAKKFGLNFVGEKTNKTQTINKNSGGNNSSDSVWSVLQSNASTNEFLLFVVGGTLYYASQPWLLYRMGTQLRKAKPSIFADNKKPAGLLVPGNLDLNTRPIVKNSDGSISTVRSQSSSFTEGGKTIHVLYPTVLRNASGAGLIVSSKEALAHYRRTGEHLGKFRSAQDANAYARVLSTSQEKLYAGGKAPKGEPQYYSRLYFDPKGTLPEDAKEFQVLQYPTIRQSENDPLEGDGKITVAKPNGCVIRPGMTIVVGPKPTLFRAGYLVTEVSFKEASPEAVEISFRTPVKPKSQDTP